MASTTTTTLTNSIPAEFIAAQVIAEARPFNVVAPLVTNAILGQGQGKVWNKSILPSGSAAGYAEGSDITSTARTTGQGSITVAEVGINTTLTLIARETAKVAGDLMTWAAFGGRAIAQKVTSDLCDLFADLNSSSAVGTTAVNMGVSDFVEAIYTLDAANAPGQKVTVLHPRQVADLFNALTGAGAVFGNLPELIRNGRLPAGTPDAGFVGELFGVPIYSTTEVVESTDKIGAMFVRDALGFVQLRPVTVVYQTDESARTTEVIGHTAYGVGELVDGYGVPIETDA